MTAGATWSSAGVVACRIRDRGDPHDPGWRRHSRSSVSQPDAVAAAGCGRARAAATTASPILWVVRRTTRRTRVGLSGRPGVGVPLRHVGAPSGRRRDGCDPQVLAWASAWPTPSRTRGFGVWGGVTTEERHDACRVPRDSLVVPHKLETVGRVFDVAAPGVHD